MGFLPVILMGSNHCTGTYVHDEVHAVCLRTQLSKVLGARVILRNNDPK